MACCALCNFKAGEPYPTTPAPNKMVISAASPSPFCLEMEKKEDPQLRMSTGVVPTSMAKRSF